jgi:hypothetical protein
MVIRNHQINKFSELSLEAFLERTILFFKKNFSEWVETKNEAELRNYIQQMIELGKSFQIFSELNIQKLLFYHIIFQFDIPLHPNLILCLANSNIDEDTRVENFYLNLKSERYRLFEITLDSII